MAPSHLLAFYYPLANNQIDYLLDEAGGYPFAVSVALPVVGNELAVSLHLSAQILYVLQTFPGCIVLGLECRGVQVHFQAFQLIRALSMLPCHKYHLMDSSSLSTSGRNSF